MNIPGGTRLTVRRILKRLLFIIIFFPVERTLRIYVPSYKVVQTCQELHAREWVGDIIVFDTPYRLSFFGANSSHYSICPEFCR